MHLLSDDACRTMGELLLFDKFIQVMTEMFRCPLAERTKKIPEVSPHGVATLPPSKARFHWNLCGIEKNEKVPVNGPLAETSTWPCKP